MQLDPQEVMRALVNRLVQRYRAEFAGIWQLNQTESVLELGALAGHLRLPEPLKKTSLEQTFLGRAVRERLPQVHPKRNGAGDDLTIWADQHRLGFLAAHPLLDDSKVQGVLLVACPKPPSESVSAMLQLHARLASVALRDAELFSSTKKTLAKLSFLVEASKALGSTLDIGELLGRILEVAKDQGDAERGTIFLVDEKTDEIWSLIGHGLERQEIRLPMGRGLVGHVAKTGEVINAPDAYADPRFNRDIDLKTGYRTRNLLALPIRNKEGKIIAALELLNKKHGSFTDDDVDFLVTLSVHIALALENAQLHRDLLVKERLEREMALAREIQRSLLPETPPVVPGFEIALLNEPCFAVGGDYYDFLKMGPGTLMVVIADVEGKGMSSALVMSNLQATLRTLVLHVHSLDHIAHALNRMILTGTRGGKYLSLFLGLIDLGRKAIHYINCGHVPPAIVRAAQAPVQLTEGGLVVGLFEKVDYKRGHVKFEPGDVLVLCTDGITEAMNTQSDEYGLTRLIACVQGTATLNAPEIVSAVSADVDQFSKGGEHLDDKVMIAIKVS
jgi:sigma-B regulation protein RsbU (phosphoserine phosphatase)